MNGVEKRQGNNFPCEADEFQTPTSARWPRRQILKVLSAGGSAVFARALVALAEEKPQINDEIIQQAEWISGLKFTEAKRKLMVDGVNRTLADYAKVRGVTLDNGVSPALLFDPAIKSGHDEPTPRQGSVAAHKSATTENAVLRDRAARRPKSPEDLAFLSVRQLAPLVRSRQVSSVELTRLYLDRLRRFDPVLLCVVTYTEELALKQAEKADREIAAGRYRGPLHGIPWGAKDILSVPGYRTTWGAKPFENQIRPEKAAVVRRLEEAGAVLVAKLSVGALAMGDVWFSGTTKNPWNTKEGSSGSSAGPAASTAAGLVGFSIGTETLGSIVSPCTRCGTTGLRPTFGRVSRYGAMALAWSMDKIGPICRSVEDCALVFRAIHGIRGSGATAAGELDPSVVDRPFHWPLSSDVRSLKVGFVEALFEEDRSKNAQKEEDKARLREWQEFDRRTLDKLRSIGFKLIPLKLPDRYPVEALRFILTAEAATAFDELTRSGRDDLLTRQTADAWPNTFRQGQMIPAVEYIRANRIRSLVMQDMEKMMAQVDVYVSPSFGGTNLLLTNLTGHPAVVVPNGFRSSNGTPTSITLMGKLYGETEALAVAHAYQQSTEFHLKRPPLNTLPPEKS